MRCAWCDNERPTLLEATAAGDVFCLVCSHVTPSGLAARDLTDRQRRPAEEPAPERTPMMRICGVFLSLCLVAATAGAQTVYNPTRIQFDSPDHTTNVSGYTVEYWLSTVDPATGSPFMTMSLAKADVTTTGQASPTYEALLSKLTPLPTLAVGQLYKATLKAIGTDTTQVSARSTASNPFARVNAPQSPAAVSLR